MSFEASEILPHVSSCNVKIFTFAAEIFVVPERERKLAVLDLFISDVIITQGLLKHV